MQRAAQLILTLYGDYVRHRSDELGVEALDELMGNFGLSSQALRSALSRMVRRGLLRSRRQGRRSFYSLTEAGRALLGRGAEKIFRLPLADSWDGRWDLVTYTIPESHREMRYRLRQELVQLGYGSLDGACWLSPNDHGQEVLALAAALGLEGRLDVFRGSYQGPLPARSLVRRCWELDKTQQKYRGFIAKYRPRLEALKDALHTEMPWESQACFVERFHLIHEYRRFHFYDPELPHELVPEDWLGPEAALLFHEYHEILSGQALKYYDAVVGKTANGHLTSSKSGREKDTTEPGSKRPWPEMPVIPESALVP